jgi:hypothetical protein
MMQLDEIREWLLTTLDSKIVEQLMCYPDLVENTAVSLGQARLKAGMSPTPLSNYAFARLIATGLADMHSFQSPVPDFDLDAEVAWIRDLAKQLIELRSTKCPAPQNPI